LSQCLKFTVDVKHGQTRELIRGAIVTTVRNARTRNAVLERLAREDAGVYEDLAAVMEPVPLHAGAVLADAREPRAFVHFVESGVISIVAQTAMGHSVAVALITREGAVGVVDVLGDLHPPFSLVVQLPGLAYRVPTALVRKHVFSCTPLHEELMANTQRVLYQVAQSAVCNRFHTAAERLAKWLLLMSTGAASNEMALTHEFLGQMVGAPRSAVTQALGVLREKGLVEHERGVIRIRNAKRLEKAACECYDVVRRAIDRR
jgi:CRP-like cAMP-binding protein